MLPLKPIKLDCTYEERYSEKNKKNYKAIFLKLSDDYEKIIFLSVPETKLLESSYKEQNDVVDFSNFE